MAAQHRSYAEKTSVLKFVKILLQFGLNVDFDSSDVFMSSV